MQTGKLSEAILKRSVLRRLHRDISPQCREYYGADCAFAPGSSGGDKAAARGADTGTPAFAAAVLPPGFERMPGVLAVAAANNLYAGGAVPEGLMLHALLPAHYEEAALQADMDAIRAGAERQGMRILGGHSQVTEAVTEAVYTAVATGRSLGAGLRRLPRPGDQLIVTKWIALGGTAALATRYKEKLRHRYPFALVDRAQGFAALMAVDREARAVNSLGDAAVHDLSQGGVFGALWELAERSGAGLEVDLKKIPIKQETVEICEYFDVNPYELYSGGSLLISTGQGEELLEKLKEESVPASVIGRVTEAAARVIRNGEDVRYLDRPKQDAWYRRQILTDERRPAGGS